MYCANCGTEIQDGIRFCPGCGQPQAAQEAPQQQSYEPYQQPQNTPYQAPNTGYQSGQNYQGGQYTSGQQSNPMAIAGLILGIAAIIFTFIFCPVGLVLAIIGIVLSGKGRRVAYLRGMATAGYVISIIALILSIIGIVAMVILFVAGASLLGGLLGGLF